MRSSGSGELLLDPGEVGLEPGDVRARLPDLAAGIDAANLVLGQHAVRLQHRIRSLPAEMAGDAGIELQLKPRLDVVGADHLIMHAGDPAAGDGQRLAHRRMPLLQLGDAPRRQREGVAIVEGDARRRGRADVRPACRALRRGFGIGRDRSRRRHELGTGRIAGAGVAATHAFLGLRRRAAASARSGAGEKQNKQGE